METETRTTHLTRADLQTAVDALAAAVDAWREKFEQAEEAKYAFLGPAAPQPLDPRDVPDNARAALVSLRQLTDTDLVDPDARESVLIVDRFFRQLETWTYPDPMWSWPEWMYLLKGTQIDPERPLESIQTLLDQRVPKSQICRLYGFVTESGEPDLYKLQREIDSPGSEFNRDSYESPRARAQRQRIEREWSERCEARAKTPRPRPPQPVRSAPESLDDLLRQKVLVSQILKMKPELCEAEILARARELGVNLDEATMPPPKTAFEAWKRRMEKRERDVEAWQRAEWAKQREAAGDAAVSAPAEGGTEQ